MKKRLIFGFILGLLIASSFSVWAAGISGQPVKCSAGGDLVGCDCVKGGIEDLKYEPVILKSSRSSYSSPFSGGRDSAYYCYVDDPQVEEPSMTNKPGSAPWGTGETRMCTEDSYTDYYDTSAIAIPVSSSGQKGNRECNFATPYCEDNKCNQCIEDNDCMRYAPSQEVIAKCLEKKSYDQAKACGYCANLKGSGDIKITFVTRGLDEKEVRGVMDSITNVEPFSYLANVKNKFTFNWVYLPSGIDSFVKIDYKVEEVQGCDQKTSNVQLGFIKTEPKIKQLAEDVCGSHDIMIFIDKNWPILNNGQNLGYKRRISNDIYQRYSQSGTVIHELGHVLCGLGEEYLASYKLSQINVDKKDDSGKCNKFFGFGIFEPNCFPLDPGCKINASKSPYRASTDNSIMRSNKPARVMMFNAIGCASCLTEMGYITYIGDAIKYCKDTPMPDGYQIFNGVYR